MFALGRERCVGQTYNMMKREFLSWREYHRRAMKVIGREVEMVGVPLANLLLRRIGAHYVDRNRGQKGARDARKLLRQARSGGALAFFPEGTFGHEPGLIRFRSGAFVVAARSSLPIVPVAIRGTRAALPPGTLMPRPGRIEIELAPVQPAPASTREEHVEQALNAAREAILQRIQDPDLA